MPSKEKIKEGQVPPTVKLSSVHCFKPLDEQIHFAALGSNQKLYIWDTKDQTWYLLDKKLEKKLNKPPKK